MKTDEIIERLARIEALLTRQHDTALTFTEACKFLSCSKSSLYKLTSGNQIPYYKPNGKKLFFSKRELTAWMLGRPVKTSSESEMEASTIVTVKPRKVG